METQRTRGAESAKKLTAKNYFDVLVSVIPLWRSLRGPLYLTKPKSEQLNEAERIMLEAASRCAIGTLREKIPLSTLTTWINEIPYDEQSWALLHLRRARTSFQDMLKEKRAGKK